MISDIIGFICMGLAAAVLATALTMGVVTFFGGLYERLLK
jgi:hypothetical protein